jgi:gas vesicle protein
MLNMSKKTLGFIALGGAVAGAAAMLFGSKRGREFGSKLMQDGGELWNGAAGSLSSIKDKALNMLGSGNGENAQDPHSGKTKTGVVNYRNLTNTNIDRGDSAGINAMHDTAGRGDSAMQANPIDPETGANIRRGDSGEDMIH